MANPFLEGVQTAKMQNEKNPFNLILNRFREAQSRRYAEDKQRKTEEAELQKTLNILSFQHNYNTELAKIKEEEKRESGLFESIRKGEVQEVSTEEEAGENVFEGTPFGATGRKFKSIKETGDISGLSNEQLIQGRALAKKLYGTRGIKEGVSAIFGELKSGKSIDQIEDRLRFAGQSPEFSGLLRNAAQQIYIGKPVSQQQAAFDTLDDLNGSPEEQKDYIKRMAVTVAPVDQKQQIMGKERTVDLLNEIQGDLNKLENNGIKTGFLSGNYENLLAKVGQVKNPEMRRIATKIAVAVINYRRSMTGVQFGQIENKEYKVLFPGINKIGSFNKASISGLKSVFEGDLDKFYSQSMGEDNYKKFFKEGVDSGSRDVKQGDKQGGQLMTDAQGNKAMVYPDGTFEEVQ